MSYQGEDQGQPPDPGASEDEAPGRPQAEGPAPVDGETGDGPGGPAPGYWPGMPDYLAGRRPVRRRAPLARSEAPGGDGLEQVGADALKPAERQAEPGAAGPASAAAEANTDSPAGPTVTRPEPEGLSTSASDPTAPATPMPEQRLPGAGGAGLAGPAAASARDADRSQGEAGTPPPDPASWDVSPAAGYRPPTPGAPARPATPGNTPGRPAGGTPQGRGPGQAPAGPARFAQASGGTEYSPPASPRGAQPASRPASSPANPAPAQTPGRSYRSQAPNVPGGRVGGASPAGPSSAASQRSVPGYDRNQAPYRAPGTAAPTPARAPAGGRYGAPVPPGPASRRAPRPAPAKRRAGCGSVLGVGLFALALAFLVFGGLLFGYVGIANALPSPADLQARASQFASTEIYDRQGQLLNEIGDPAHGRRTVVPLDQISKNLIDATISTEDPNYYEHPGVDPTGLARAVYYALRNRDVSAGPGGSTITQQLVKLVYLSPEKSVTRKVKEAVLAAEITRRYDKNTVLQIYLNEINYGNLAYGIEAASETYFGKHAKDLDLAEASMLAGLPQAPAYYDPYTKMWEADGQPGAVKRRQGVVLGLMVKHGSITAEQADAAYREQLKLKPLQMSYTMKWPHFVYYVRSDVEQVLGPALLARGGLRIYTTLDPKVQGVAEQEVAAQVKQLNAKGATDGALVAVRPGTGEILAMVGSADFNNEQISGQINMAVTPRQPGSSIKPLTYLTAFSLPAPKIDDKTQPSDDVSAVEPAGYWTPATAILDITTQFPDGQGRPPYVPKNYDNKEHGIVSVRSALANSYNIPAVKTLQHIGIDRLKDTAVRMGITTLTRPDYGLSLTLGGGEVTLLEMTGAYATLANGGSRAPLSPIACVIDAGGQMIWRGNGADQVQGCQKAQPGGQLLVSPQPAAPAVDPQATYLITSILSDTEARRPAFGNAATLLSLPDRPAAAKTGTTNDNRDAWTLGYTPDLAVGVWVGNADYKPMQDVAGSIGAAPIWQKVMIGALQGTQPKQFTVPQGIQRIKVCADSGTLPSEACPRQREEVFASDRGPLPARFDLHQRLRIDKATGQLATEFTPADRVETKDYMLFPPRYKAWAEGHGFPQPNTQAQQYAFPPELTLNSPAQNSQVSGVVQVTGRVHLPDPLVWRLEYGVGPNPIGWGILHQAQKGDVDGSVGDWDTAETVQKHDQREFSLRLAAYDPAHADYPVAVSNVVYVTVAAPTETPLPTASPTLPATATPAATATALATPTSPATPTTAPSSTPAPEATETPGPTPTALPTLAPTDTPAPETGSSGGQVAADITDPAQGARVSGAVAIMGDAAGKGFASYRLEVAPGANPAADAWSPLQPDRAQPSTATGGLLGIWQSQNVAPGMYTLRLTVLDKGGSPHIATVTVEVGPAGGQP